MSPDRTTITRAEAIRRRKEEDQKRREKLTPKNVSNPKPAPTPKTNTRFAKQIAERSKSLAKPKVASSTYTHSVSPAPASRWSRRYDIAMSAPYGKSQNFNAPKVPSISFTMPHISYGPRWLSFFIALFCLVDLYLMLTIDPFIVHDADILGNKRVSTQAIQDMLRIANLPAAFLDPALIQTNILASFPDITTVKVEVNIPNSVVISIDERIPMAAWQQEGQTVWVDALGYAFPPRGQVEKLPTITAKGAPPPPNIDPMQPSGARPFLPTDLCKAIEILTPNLPQGAVLIFDPQYGLGWSDPRGWQVYFGHSIGNNATKLQVYQTMLDHLSKKNIQPILISVEYPNAPFYRVEQ
jgi:hypothetical protein